MLGVTSAGSAVRAMSGKLSTQALKKIPQKALTQTLYYPVIKRVLGIFGTKLTKNTFAKGISKAVPVVGGVVSGGINYLSTRPTRSVRSVPKLAPFIVTTLVGRPSLGKNSEITGTGYLFDPFLSSSEHAVPMKVLESNRTQIIIELNSFFIFIFY